MSPESDEVIDDPVALARLFIAGRMLKRGTTIQLVRDLVALVEAQTEPAAWHDSICEASPSATTLPAGIPNVTGYDARPPIELHATPAGAVFLGRDANRYFTRSEAIALAGAIARAAANARNV